MEINFADLTPRPLQSNSGLTVFDCKDKDLNEFLWQDALEYQNKNIAQTTLIYYQNQLIGYYTLACDAISLNFKEKRKFSPRKHIHSYPAIKIARMAFIKEFQNKGLGTLILENIKGFVYKLNGEGVGCRFITVDAYPHRVNFYLKRGFKYNKHKIYKDKEHPSLRYDIWNLEQAKESERRLEGPEVAEVVKARYF